MAAEREGREGSTVMWNQMLLISCVTVRAPAIATMSHSTSKQRECFINQKPRWHIYKHAVAGGERYSLPQQVLFYRSIHEITVNIPEGTLFFSGHHCFLIIRSVSNENKLLDFLRQRDSNDSCPAVEFYLVSLSVTFPITQI